MHELLSGVLLLLVVLVAIAKAEIGKEDEGDESDEV